MSNLAYLQDPEWIKARKSKWKKYCAMALYGSSQEEIASQKAYFFDGDIKHLLKENSETELFVVINSAPFKDISYLVDNISAYWSWVLESSDTRDNFEQLPDLNERFMGHMFVIFSRRYETLSPDVCVDLFFWLYGDVYNKNRKVSLIHGGVTTTIFVNCDVNDFSQRLLSGIIYYLWRLEEGPNICIFKSFIPYFLTIYPNMSPIFFDKKLPATRKYTTPDGTIYRKAVFIWNRYILCLLNGFITENLIFDLIPYLILIL